VGRRINWVIFHRYRELHMYTVQVSALTFGLQCVVGPNWVILHRKHHMYRVGERALPFGLQ
jgi:hypothetical protein